MSGDFSRRPALRALVEAKLQLHWSPEQIAPWLTRASPEAPELRVSHESCRPATGAG